MRNAYFYPSVAHDRQYDATSFECWLKKFFTTGVFANELETTVTDSLKIQVSTGYANIDGKVQFVDSAVTLAVSVGDSIYPRIDNVVIERNDSDRIFYVKIVEGVPAATPSPAAKVWSGTVKQLVIAQIAVAAGTTAISQSNITDTRTDTSLCGYVTGTVKETDFSQFTIQFDTFFKEYQKKITDTYNTYDHESDTYFENYQKKVADSYIDYTGSITDYETLQQTSFNGWFNTIKGQLSTDAAGNLQNEIDGLNKKEFELAYGLVNGTTNIVKNVYGKTTQIVETSTEAVCTTTFVKNGTTRTITTKVVPASGEYNYISTAVIEKVSTGRKITESYTKEAKA